MQVSKDVKQLAGLHFEKIVAIRRDIHAHPELGWDVHRTAAIAAKAMEQLGMKVRRRVGKTGVVADLAVSGARKTIALRADMDALPILEENDLPYKSKIDGTSHMCGHDSHTAMLIGAARIIDAMKDRLQANVRFIFQPNEENLPGGAPGMIADGAIDDVDEIFGLHVWPTVDTGKFSICKGPALAQPDEFHVVINGVGGHAAVPHLAIDPILIGSQYVTAVQSIISRHINPINSAVVSITEFHGGTTHNVIPASIRLTGTVRTYAKADQVLIRRKLQEILQAMTAMYGATCSFDYTEGYPVTYNHEASAMRAVQTAAQILGEKNVVYPGEPTMGGEDFAYYTEKIPGCFSFLGTRNEAKGAIYEVHDPRFILDEDAMIHGMAHHAVLALEYR